MTEQVDQSEGHQEVCHLLDPRVLRASNVCSQVFNYDGILPQEYFQCLLHVWKMIKCGQGKYYPMSGACCPPNMTSQLTMFGPWKHIYSTLHPSGCSLKTRPNPPCAPPAVLQSVRTRRCIPGGYVSMPRQGYLSLSVSSFNSCLAVQPGFPGGSRIPSHPGCCTFLG